MVEQIISTKMLFGDLEHITSTRMLLVTSTRIICGDLNHITSTRMLLVISTKIICGDLEHITSTRMLLVTSSRSSRPRGYQEARFSQNIFSEILRTIFLMGWKLVVFLRILGEKIKTTIISYKNPGEGEGKWGIYLFLAGWATEPIGPFSLSTTRKFLFLLWFLFL